MLPQCSNLYADFQQLAVSCGFQCVRSEASEGESVCVREKEKATEKLEQKHLVRYEIINEEFTVIG